MTNGYLRNVTTQLEYYKVLAEKTFSQVADDDLRWRYNEESNSIAVIVKHLSGNMLSRWTDFLNTDGEKPWRDRDVEFIDTCSSKEEMMKAWEGGWKVLFATLQSLGDDDLCKVVHIRNQEHTVVEAINRQLAHYCYHVGQIVFIGKMLAPKWNSLSIPRGSSKEYNQARFSDDALRS